MPTVPKPRLTVSEYLTRERTAEVRSDYLDGQTRIQPRSSPAHVTIVTNLVGEIGMTLKGGPCRTFSCTQRIRVSATGLFTYPDIVIVCGKAEFEDNDTLLNPVAIIEVLSPATETHDRGAKFRQYQQLESVQEYVLVSQDEPVVERFVRRPDGTWVLTTWTGLAGGVEFHTVPVRIPLADVFRGVEFPRVPARSPDGT